MSNWLKKRILYQIFPDLFCKDTDSNPSKKYYGGTIKGIISKLDYVKDFGFDAIYLNPIFRSVSSHRYNVLDYFSVDPILGTLEDFDSLVKECHSRDIKLILDIPLNHVSQEHEWFKSVVNNDNSPYSNYFILTEDGYNKWRGSDLVELNLDNPEVIEKLITSPNGVLKFWIDRDIDGIRLDCANDLGMNITNIIRQKSHEWNRDILVMGEVFNFASEWSRVLDSIQSYYLTGLLFSLVKDEISVQTFSNGIDYLVREFDYEVLLNSLNILSSHDTSRILDIVDNIDVYRILIAVQFTFPGVPVVLYGEEIGMKTRKMNEESSRNPMEWDESKWNKNIMNLYKQFISLRRYRKELQEGKFKNITSLVDYELIGYLRFTDKREEFSIVLINPNDKFIEKRVFIPYSHFHDALKMVDYLSGEEFLCEISSIKVKLAPYQVAILCPNWKYIKGYSFYKRQ
ncbi:MAG: alpha-amylase family glycosyl hydrolase [Brevinematales bacterium]|nr:alpha-amylase family glycosyl hydrolase [Brevinematales bacterium]